MPVRNDFDDDVSLSDTLALIGFHEQAVAEAERADFFTTGAWTDVPIKHLLAFLATLAKTPLVDPDGTTTKLRVPLPPHTRLKTLALHNYLTAMSARGVAFIPAEYTAPTQKNWRARYLSVESYKEDAANVVVPKTVVKPLLKVEGWANWEEELEDALHKIRGSNADTLLSYLLRDNEVPTEEDFAVDHEGDVEAELILEVKMEGPGYTADNQLLFDILAACTSESTEVRSAVTKRDVRTARNGRKVFLALRALCNGPQAKVAHCERTTDMLKKTLFDGRTINFPIEKFNETWIRGVERYDTKFKPLDHEIVGWYMDCIAHSKLEETKLRCLADTATNVEGKANNENLRYCTDAMASTVRILHKGGKFYGGKRGGGRDIGEVNHYQKGGKGGRLGKGGAVTKAGGGASKKTYGKGVADSAFKAALKSGGRMSNSVFRDLNKAQYDEFMKLRASQRERQVASVEMRRIESTETDASTTDAPKPNTVAEPAAEVAQAVAQVAAAKKTPDVKNAKATTVDVDKKANARGGLSFGKDADRSADKKPKDASKSIVVPKGTTVEADVASTVADDQADATVPMKNNDGPWIEVDQKHKKVATESHSKKRKEGGKSSKKEKKRKSDSQSSKKTKKSRKSDN